ncbi:hypothetical protein AGLY_014826, partial [Aphis glycines]
NEKISLQVFNISKWSRIVQILNINSLHSEADIFCDKIVPQRFWPFKLCRLAEYSSLNKNKNNFKQIQINNSIKGNLNIIFFKQWPTIYLISTHGENIRQIIAGIPGIFGIIVVSQRVNLSFSFKHRFPATNNLVCRIRKIVLCLPLMIIIRVKVLLRLIPLTDISSYKLKLTIVYDSSSVGLFRLRHTALDF